MLGTRPPARHVGLGVLTGGISPNPFLSKHPHPHFLRSAMNRFKLLSGGLTESLMVLVAASAVAQEAPGQWTMTGRTYDLQRYSPLTAINKQNVKSLKTAWTCSTAVLTSHVANSMMVGRQI